MDICTSIIFLVAFANDQEMFLFEFGTSINKES